MHHLSYATCWQCSSRSASASKSFNFRLHVQIGFRWFIIRQCNSQMMCRLIWSYTSAYAIFPERIRVAFNTFQTCRGVMKTVKIMLSEMVFKNALVPQIIWIPLSHSTHTQFEFVIELILVLFLFFLENWPGATFPAFTQLWQGLIMWYTPFTLKYFPAK